VEVARVKGSDARNIHPENGDSLVKESEIGVRSTGTWPLRSRMLCCCGQTYLLVSAPASNSCRMKRLRERGCCGLIGRAREPIASHEIAVLWSKRQPPWRTPVRNGGPTRRTTRPTREPLAASCKSVYERTFSAGGFS
jgi:hypothetical protein